MSVVSDVCAMSNLKLRVEILKGLGYTCKEGIIYDNHGEVYCGLGDMTRTFDTVLPCDLNMFPDPTMDLSSIQNMVELYSNYVEQSHKGTENPLTKNEVWDLFEMSLRFVWDSDANLLRAKPLEWARALVATMHTIDYEKSWHHNQNND
jgi:hypothetical protein